jgi:hypothetical protein
VNIDVPFERIPRTVDDEVAANLMHYFVPLSVVQRPHNSEPRMTFIGSGTLVEIHGGFHILTAAHVWNEAKEEDELCLALTSYPSGFVIPIKAIAPREIWTRDTPEWGPDLALLDLPRPFVSTIAAYKSFLNLALHRSTLDAHPPAIEKGLWAVTGMVGEFSDVQRRVGADFGVIEGTAQVRAFLSPACDTHSRDGYDYIDPKANLNLPGVPASFGGVSGGGLWQVGLSMGKSGEIQFDGRRYFRGIAFWESDPLDGRRVVRCHGPLSLFEKAWSVWGLPR